MPRPSASGHSLMGAALRAQLAQRLPFYYGWVVFALAASINYTSRPLMSVAVLSVFVSPMTETFGWSRGLFSGAVSLGGLCAVILSPIVGRLIDKYGSGMMISAASALAGICAVGLSTISQVWAFYALYVPGRMAFASPLELATSTAISNWFIRRRAMVLALLVITQGTGLAAMPLVAQLLITGWGWRQTWAALGLYAMAVGIVPALLLMARRPEDMGLEPDPEPGGRGPAGVNVARRLRDSTREQDGHGRCETHFTLHQALHTRAFWMLATFSAAAFMAQAGVSLHQVSHYIAQGLPGPSAAIMASVFAMAQVPSGLLWSTLTRRVPVRYVLALAGLSVALGAASTAFASTLAGGVLAAGIFGWGIGGLHLLLRFAWAEYYGRRHLGTIQGITLPIQIGGQALGPIIAGLVFDATGAYYSAFVAFASVAIFGSVMVLTAVPPRRSGAPVA
ncbi:L-lactate transporter [Candidatus Entotheonellaceae bacterium PAL068K]